MADCRDKMRKKKRAVDSLQMNASDFDRHCEDFRAFGVSPMVLLEALLDLIGLTEEDKGWPGRKVAQIQL